MIPLPKLSELTPQQRERVLEIRQWWMNNCDTFTPIDEKKAIEDITWMYTTANQPVPPILRVDSPLACQVAINQLTAFEQKEGLGFIFNHEPIDEIILNIHQDLILPNQIAD